MKNISVLLVCILVSSFAMARDLKIEGQEFLPLQGTIDGKMGGAYYEAMKRVCEKLKFNCTFEVVPLTRSLANVKEGKADVVLGIAKNAEREAVFNFPGFISKADYTFFVKKGTAAKYSKPEDFKGKTIGVHKGSATGTDLDNLNAKLGNIFKIEGEAIAQTSSKKLASGRYGDDGAVYCARPICGYQAKVENLDIEPVKFEVTIQNHSAALSKSTIKPDEIEKIHAALKEVMQTPEMKKIFADFGITIHPDMN